MVLTWGSCWQSWKPSRMFARILSHDGVFFDPGNPLTFLKETDIVVGKELIQDISHRVDGNTAHPNLIMKMRARGPSACPNLSNLIPSFHLLPNSH